MRLYMYADAIVMLTWGLHAVLLFHARGVVSEASQHLANAPRWRLFRTGNSGGKQDTIRGSAGNVMYTPSGVSLLRKEPVMRQPLGTAIGGRLVSSIGGVAHSTYGLKRLRRRPGTAADAFHVTVEAKHSPQAVNDVSHFKKGNTHAISVHYKTSSATSQGSGDQHAISEAATLSKYHQKTGESKVHLLESASHQARLRFDESRSLSHTELFDSEAILPPLQLEIY